MKTPCAVCQTPTQDMFKRFVAGSGFCCADCFEFLGYAEKTLRRKGAEGVIANPLRFSPLPEKP